MPYAALALAASMLLSGCVAYTVASTAVSVTATAVEATADVVGAGVDLVVGGDED
ncbi:hypothetical protein [Rubrimonas cliftonensis]|uniref:Lipoprotein n=1 Tax=Rubrimonas cliftonensis TaxID=89524 RepID=A0A1H4A1F3_9RHOB|nr:hypothetical protein [Rubrimonas cliftonensis]SEA29869.1 hypothetical protein SAMN05444370_10427 [Rubrimonas cliftonensis]